MSLTSHTVEYDPFIKSQLASRNQLSGFTWCEFGHVTPNFCSCCPTTRLTTSLTSHTVDYDPFIKSQLASRNQPSGFTWCKFGHVTPNFCTCWPTMRLTMSLTSQPLMSTPSTATSWSPRRTYHQIVCFNCLDFTRLRIPARASIDRGPEKGGLIALRGRS